MEESSRVIALLIDAENVSPKYIEVILDELSLYGTPAYKRIYGDWTSLEMASWKKKLLETNLTPIQQFSYTQGKNASDSSMIIDAMDILYAKNCDGFCIVSSDSDFTRLASRLRESRMFVIGMGESKTPTSFKSACDTFKYLDVLMNAKSKPAGKAPGRAIQTKTALAPAAAPVAGNGAVPPAKNAKAKPAARAAKPKAGAASALEAAAAPELVPEPAPAALPEAPAHMETHEESASGFVPLEDIVGRIKSIIDMDSDEDGFMSLSQMGSILGRQYADFDTRNYGFSKLHKLIDYTGEFETRYDQIPGGGKNMMIKNK